MDNTESVEDIEMPFGNLTDDNGNDEFASLFDKAVAEGVEKIKEDQPVEAENVPAKDDPELVKKIDELLDEITRFKRDNDAFITGVESTMGELMKTNTSTLQKKVEQQIRAIAEIQDAVVNRMTEVQAAGTQQQIELLKSELLDMREQIEQFIISEQYLEENLDTAINDAVSKNVEKISEDLEKSYQTADKIGETIQKLGNAFKRTMSGLEWQVGAKSRMERNLLYIMGGSSVANLILTWIYQSDGTAGDNQIILLVAGFCLIIPLLLDIIFWRKH